MQTIPQPPAGVTCTQPLIYCCFTSEPHTYTCGTRTPIKLTNVLLKVGQVCSNKNYKICILMSIASLQDKHRYTLLPYVVTPGLWSHRYDQDVSCHILSVLTLNLPMTTIVAQPFNVIKWQLKFNPVA